ncbi:UNVERIFIED_CONTAM: hypothetical protein K2H54_016546 [Gekko kuhli]
MAGDVLALSVANSPIDGAFPGLQSLVPKACTVRVTNLALPGGVNHSHGPEFAISQMADDAAGNETNKIRKPKNAGLGTSNPRSIHAEIAIRQAKGTSATLPSHGMSQSGPSRMT